jgi:hypothetical protein
MSAPDILPGSKFRILRGNGGTPEAFAFVCLATTKTFRRTNDFEDVSLPDCDDPDATPWRKSKPRAKSWDLSMSGVVDVARFANIRADADADEPRNYQVMLGTEGEGAGTYTGLIWFDNLEITSQDNGIVRFTANMRGDDELVWEAA